MPPSFLSIDLLELVIELALIWVVIYFTVRFLQGTRGAGIVKGFAVLLAAFVLLQLLGLGTERFARLNFIIDYFVGIVAILLIVIFQPELRQATMRLGQARLLRAGRRDEHEARVDAIAEAVTFLSRSRFGAIIATTRVPGNDGSVAPSASSTLTMRSRNRSRMLMMSSSSSFTPRSIRKMRSQSCSA